MGASGREESAAEHRGHNSEEVVMLSSYCRMRWEGAGCCRVGVVFPEVAEI